MNKIIYFKIIINVSTKLILNNYFGFNLTALSII
jgi:hypothetical protein